MEYIFLPSAPIAMPRAYWLINRIFSSLVMLVEPSNTESAWAQHAVDHRSSNDFDTEIVSTVYSDDCIVLPHRHYALLTSDFRSHDHLTFLRSTEEAWDLDIALRDAKFLRFSD